MNKSMEFFETRFQKQIGNQGFELNPFETLALNYLKGDVLDLGSGLGNLSLAAGQRGHEVMAVDASMSAIQRINSVARKAGLAVKAIQADLSTWKIDRSYDTIIAIGLLMFFNRNTAIRLLDSIRDHVKVGGRAIINVLIEGTTYMDMFDPENYYLFNRQELELQFSTWTILVSVYQTFPAPGGTVKEFSTVIVEKPGMHTNQ